MAKIIGEIGDLYSKVDTLVDEIMRLHREKDEEPIVYPGCFHKSE